MQPIARQTFAIDAPANRYGWALSLHRPLSDTGNVFSHGGLTTSRPEPSETAFTLIIDESFSIPAEWTTADWTAVFRKVLRSTTKEHIPLAVQQCPYANLPEKEMTDKELKKEGSAEDQK